MNGAKEELTEEEQDYLDRTYSYHTPKEGQAEAYRALRHKAKETAETYMILAPHSPERVTALRCLEQSVMWANAAIARRGT